MEIIKPYEWHGGIVYGHTREESKKAWDSAWEFINNIDMISEFKEFTSIHEEYDLYDFREYIDEKYEYHDEIGDSMFNLVKIEVFADYLKKKYSNFDYFPEKVQIHHFKFN